MGAVCGISMINVTFSLYCISAQSKENNIHKHKTQTPPAEMRPPEMEGVHATLETPSLLSIIG